MTDRSASHDTFAIERTYPTATPGRTFSAWTDPKAKATWMDDPDWGESAGNSPYDLDFRIGGRERFESVGPDGKTYRYEAVYYDIVPDRRIVYCYEMYTGTDRISVSVSTVEFTPAGDGTHLTYTEQCAFLDGLDKVEQRREGTGGMLDNLGRYLTA